MKRFAFALIMLPLMGWAQNAQQLPETTMDPEVRTGKLDNGLTYYIRHNAFPEKRASFLIAQKVGSVQEEDSQRGLAHFLEHMCFNGSDNFPGNGIIDYLRTLGVEFGRNLNAFTSVERTVYYIDKVPTERISALDSCLLVLKDWSCGLTLDDKEIDKERGVIHEEWRMRSDAQSRVLNDKLPELYPGCKYGYRWPIGTMEVVDNFKYQELKDYYKKWYHPGNQGIVVVGDIDIDRTEEKIREMFAGITEPQDAAPVEAIPVPDNEEAIVVLARDKEPMYDVESGQQRPNELSVMFKHPAIPREAKSNMSYLIQKYVMQAACSMLSDRFNEAAQEENCPYLSAHASNGNYIISSTVSSLSIEACPKDAAHTAEALKEVVKEAIRAAEQGFSESEYNRFKENYMASLESAVSSKDNRESLSYGMECVENFLSGEPIPGINALYGIMKRFSAMIPVDAVNQTLSSLVTKSDKNLAILSFNIEAEGATYPTREDLMKALADARATELVEYVDNAVEGALVKQLPKPGTIVKEESIDKLGYKEITLSNGVKVILKHTDFKKDEVFMMGIGPGGSSLYGPADFDNLKLFNAAIDASGLGGLQSKELEKALSGKKANATLLMGENGTQMALSAQARPKDMETMMQLAYLYFTDITKDEKSFARLVKQTQTELEGKETQPMLIFQDSLRTAIYDHNPRIRSLTPATLAKVSYDRILEIAKERTASANGWEFTLVGNFDEETLKPLLCQYLGGLPASRKNNRCPRSLNMAMGTTDCFFNVEMETPMSIVALNYLDQKSEYTLEGSIQATMVGQLLTMSLLKSIREDQGLAYSVEAVGMGMKEDDGSHIYRLVVVCPVSAENTALAMGVMQNEVANLCNEVSNDLLDKVKKQMAKQFEESEKNNFYWISAVDEWRKWGIDVTQAQQVIASQTPDKIKAFMKSLLGTNNAVFVTMGPK